MKFTTFPPKYLMLTSFLMFNLSSYAVNSTALEQQANTTIKELYHTLNTKPITSMPERINWISHHFLGTIYELGALGEGPKARYDQFPQYRIDAFDCDTFVNTVLSLALADSVHSFQQCQKYNRYKEGKVSYLYRNHFMSLDWNINNQQRGILKDITFNIKDKTQHPVALYAVAFINKPGWYQHKTLATIRLQKENKKKQQDLLEELKKKGSQLESVKAKIPYIPFTVLFSKHNEPDLYLFSQIPDGSIIEIVRPNWDLRQLIGTALNVSHLGFAIKKNGTIYFRQASSQQGKVIDVPLIDYLKDAKSSPTIKGINIQVVLPSKPLNGNCKSENRI